MDEQKQIEELKIDPPHRQIRGILGALRVYAEGGQDVGEQGCVEHAA